MRGGNRKGVGHKPFELELVTDIPTPRKPERGQNNETPDRRNQLIPIPQTTLTAIEGLGGTGSLIVALLEESFRLQLAKDEAKKLSRRLNKSKKRTT